MGSPLSTPWWAEANIFFGFVVFYWIITPILYYTNVWYAQYMPVSSLNAYNNKGEVYNVTKVIDKNSSLASLDLEAYRAYSPLYLPVAFAMSYGLSFLAITATVTHALIHFWRPIKLQFKRSLQEQPDIHARLMSVYPQVPEWHYMCIFAVTFTFACLAITLWPTGMPIWALVIALLVSIVYVIPIGMIQALTNKQVPLNVLTELIIGFMLPGKPVAMMAFKTFGYITVQQAIQFTADFKLGHYMKVPPRPMFWGQIVATVVAGTVQLGIQAWMFENIPELCDEHQKNFSFCFLFLCSVFVICNRKRQARVLPLLQSLV
jgi:OPT family small oligopeptide transporter